jgi:hypothetical protein
MLESHQATLPIIQIDDEGRQLHVMHEIADHENDIAFKKEDM